MEVQVGTVFLSDVFFILDHLSTIDVRATFIRFPKFLVFKCAETVKYYEISGMKISCGYYGANLRDSEGPT